MVKVEKTKNGEWLVYTSNNEYRVYINQPELVGITEAYFRFYLESAVLEKDRISFIPEGDEMPKTLKVMEIPSKGKYFCGGNYLEIKDEEIILFAPDKYLISKEALVAITTLNQMIWRVYGAEAQTGRC